MKQYTSFPTVTAGATASQDTVISKKTRKRRRLLLALGCTLLGIVLMAPALKAYLRHSKVAAIMQNGICDPKVESGHTIIAAAMKHGLDTANIVTPQPSAFSPLMKLGIPEAIIFDKQGNRLVVHSDKSCNAGVFGFIPGLVKGGKYDIKEPHSMAAFLSSLKDIQGNTLSQNLIDSSADYYVFFLWSAWTGKMSEDHVKVWEHSAKNNTKAKLQVIKIDVDLQQWWPLAAQDSMQKKYGSMISETLAAL